MTLGYIFPIILLLCCVPLCRCIRRSLAVCVAASENLPGTNVLREIWYRRVSWKGTKKKSKRKKDKQDLYALLGLKNERWTATESQLKNGKRRPGGGNEGVELFLLVFKENLFWDRLAMCLPYSIGLGQAPFLR